jgi:TatD DNase family protein
VLDFGAWISFTGVVTFKNARDVAEAAKLVPADRIMVETDAPYLPPEPVRKLWPNEPQHVAHIGRFLAALRGVDAAALEAQLDANAERFFGIKLR